MKIFLVILLVGLVPIISLSATPEGTSGEAGGTPQPIITNQEIPQSQEGEMMDGDSQMQDMGAVSQGEGSIQNSSNRLTALENSVSALKKWNRTLFFLVLILFALVGYILFRMKERKLN